MKQLTEIDEPRWHDTITDYCFTSINDNWRLLGHDQMIKWSNDQMTDSVSVQTHPIATNGSECNSLFMNDIVRWPFWECNCVSDETDHLASRTDPIMFWEKQKRRNTKSAKQQNCFNFHLRIFSHNSCACGVIKMPHNVPLSQRWIRATG